MLEVLKHLFASGGFIPHGHCFRWKPALVWLHVMSDSLIALAYYSIPITLVRGILEIVARLEQLDDQWVPFASELRQLAKSFQTKKIREFLKSYTLDHE